jgi:tripartite-type tricarboxylate transporter receptor subunit TctC
MNSSNRCRRASLHRRLAALTVLVCAGAVAYDAEAQSGAFPTKTIRIVMPYPAGGPTDTTARTIAPRLSEALGQQVIIDNRPGASTILGTEIVARSPADGHTLLMVTSTISMSLSVFAKLPYDTQRDLTPVTQVISTPFALLVHPSLPVRTTAEFVKLAKARPGQLNHPSSGIGSANHLAIVLFSQVAGFTANHVPYKGTAQGIADLVSGQMQFSLNNPMAGLPLVRANKLRLLGTTGRARLAILPDVPVLSEAVPGYEAGNWHAMFAPAATPRETVVRLQSEVAKALAVPEIRQRFLDLGAELGGSTPDEFAAFFRSEIAKWAKTVKAAGIKPE